MIATRHLCDFTLRHSDAAAALRAWAREAHSAEWKTPKDIKNRFAGANFLRGNRVVFNLKGNEYRLVVAVAYRFGIVCIKFVGTHAEYDAIDAETVEINPR